MRKLLHKIILSSILLAFLGCAAPHWTVVKNQTLKSNKLNLNISIPEGWFMFSNIGYNQCPICFNNEISVLLTKDYYLLNYIVVSKLDTSKMLLPTKIKLDTTKTLLEIANDYSNGLKELNFCKQRYHLDALEFTDFLGREGFKIKAHFNNPDGLPCILLVYGTIIDNILYTAKLFAPKYYYYYDILPSFKKFVSQLRYINSH